MNVSEIRLHWVSQTVTNGDVDRCHWCDATLDDSRQPRPQAGYAIEAGRRLLVEVELWACADCAGRAELLTETDRADLQQRLDEMAAPLVGRCEACEAHG